MHAVGPMLAEYEAATAAKVTANSALHRTMPELQGLHIHELQPIKLGSDPVSVSNKAFLTPEEHYQTFSFWNAVLRSAMRGR